ncbi:MAG: hypothetical protein Q7K65_03455 [Candidatus Buchananbacteria bacterium]|nr:hypothetical protein [Candidatus Buchananbacteria bacterium]
MALENKADKSFKVNISFNGGRCSMSISGRCDWTKDSVVINKHLKTIWTHNEITDLDFDCRGLFFMGYDDGSLVTYFLALILELRNKCNQKNIKFSVRLKSREQVDLFNLWGGRMWKILEKNLLFDNPD